MKKLATLIAATALLAVGASAAQARSVAYVGKATGGEKVTFKLSGNRVSHLVTGVPTVCLSSSPLEAGNESGMEPFLPPGSFRFGPEAKRKAQQRSAMWFGKITKFYRVKVRHAAHGRVTGHLQIAFSYLQPMYDYMNIHSVPFYCVGKASFTARPR
jgi:hypothetical protein